MKLDFSAISQKQQSTEHVSAGLSIRSGTRYFYPPKMVFGISWF